MTQLEALKEIAKRDGGLLRPQAVVDAARPVSSPLHGAFCWNNTEAAQKYRLLQAQQLIRSFRVTVEDNGAKYETACPPTGQARSARIRTDLPRTWQKVLTYRLSRRRMRWSSCARSRRVTTI